MKREKLVRAFGYGIKEANFHNSYGDSYILVALRKRDKNRTAAAQKRDTCGF